MKMGHEDYRSAWPHHLSKQVSMSSIPQLASGVNQATGLVYERISARPFSAPSHEGRDVVIGVHPGGLAARVRTVGGDDMRPARRGGGLRGQIEDFSAASQRRFRHFVAGVDWRGGDVFLLTLTWHSTWGPPESWTRARRAFEARLERSWPGRFASLWKLEPQTRGAPHFHVVIIWRGGGPDLHKFRLWVSAGWNSIVAPDDAQHLRAGTQVLKCRNLCGPDMGRWLHYLGKALGYLGKGQGQRRFVDDTTGEVVAHHGRIWGHSEDIPVGEPDMYTLNTEQYQELLRRLRRWGRGSTYAERLTVRWAGWLLMGDGALLAQLLRGLDASPWDG